MTSLEPIQSNPRTDEATHDVPTAYKDLGTLICGKEVNDCVEIVNNKSTPTTFTMLEEEDNSLDHFLAPVESLRIGPGKTGKLKLTFVSHVPNTYYDRWYLITDGSEPVLKIRVRARSIGPIVKPSHITIKFFILRGVVLNAKRFELENNSQCPARYQFERGNSNRPFHIAQPGEVLQAKSRVTIHVKFTPTKLGIYRKRIFCLVQYHPPLSVTLIGVFKPGLKIEPARLVLHHPVEETWSNNYAAFMGNMNESNVADDIDPCLDWPMATKRRTPTTVRFAETEEIMDEDSWDTDESTTEKDQAEGNGKNPVRAILSKNYVNMGSKSSENLKLVNMSNSMEFYFEWSNENAKFFNITPRSGTLKENQILQMKLHFDSETPDRIYNGELDLKLFPVDNHGEEACPGDVTLPESVTLTIIGHSFSSGSAGWLEQCEIEPRNLNLPPCVPGQLAYATLLIKRSGHLPVMFEFIPPRDSSIKIKPPLGYIDASYQIFVVEFDSREKPEGTYTEPWLVAYNTPSKYLGRVSISARIEIPRIVVGDGNRYCFDTTLPGGMTMAAVPVTNPTGLRLRYELIVPDNVTWIDIPSPCFELEPLAGNRVTVAFKPTESKEYVDYICCLVRPADVPDSKATTSIEFRGSCQEGTLVCTPPAHDFGKPIFGTRRTATVHIYNFTPIFMHFRLISVDEDSETGEAGTCDIEVVPSEGSIPGQSSIEAEVSMTPYSTSRTTRIVLCKLLASESGDELPRKPIVLFSGTIEGILPTFQIIDLIVDGGGPLFSPDWLWKMLDVNGLNKALQKLLPGQEERFHVNVPVAPTDSRSIVIRILIESKSSCDLTVQIQNPYTNHYKRSPTWLSDTETEGCNYMSLLPSTIYLKARSRGVLKMTLTYEVFGTTFYEWSIKLSLNRILRLRAEVTAYPLDEAAPTSLYVDPDFRLRPVFIGEMAPPLQLLWMYNNSPLSSSYVLDKALLRQSTAPFPDVFDCLNPNGNIPPYSCLPLMFVFQPNELKLYTVATQLCVRVNTYVTLTVTGIGTMDYCRRSMLSHEVTIPEKQILKLAHVNIESSISVFTFPPFRTLSSARRIFYLKNTSRNKVWAFRWHSFEARKVIRARVEPSGGFVQPGESLLSQLIVESFIHPTSLSFSVPCDVTDYTALKAYRNALQIKEEAELQYEDCFTINEKGTFSEVPYIDVPPKPSISHIFITVRATIIDSEGYSSKLYPDQILRLEGEKALRLKPRTGINLTEERMHVVNHTLEQIMWKIVSSNDFKKQLADYWKGFSGAAYLQILPGSEKETEKKRKSSFDSLSKHLIQRVIETTILDILTRK